MTDGPKKPISNRVNSTSSNIRLVLPGQVMLEHPSVTHPMAQIYSWGKWYFYHGAKQNPGENKKILAGECLFRQEF